MFFLQNLAVHRISCGLFVGLFLFTLSACSKTEEFVACEEPRPLQCVETYEPVCAKLESGELSSRTNLCSACSDYRVVKVKPNSCE